MGVQQKKTYHVLQRTNSSTKISLEKRFRMIMILKPHILLWTIFSLCSITVCEACAEADVAHYTVKDAILEHHVISRMKTMDVTECVRNCIKRSQCQSINYDTKKGTCELNDYKPDSESELTNAHERLYSDVSVWPSQIEPDCFDRPCSENEVCVPGSLVQQDPTHPGCTYTCFSLVPSVVPIIHIPIPNTTVAAPVTTSTSTTSTSTTSTTTSTTTTTTTSTTTPTTTTESPSIEGVRLRDDGSYPTVMPANMAGGRLELLYDGTWRPVLFENNFDWRETQVVCRQMGLTFGGTYHESDGDKILYGDLSQRIALSDLDCGGDETSLSQCSGATTITQNGDSSMKSVGITCYETFVNDTSAVNVKDNGRVQFIYNGISGVVNGVEQADADVVCKTLNGQLSTGVILPLTSQLESCWIRSIVCTTTDAPPHPFFCKNSVWLHQRTCVTVSAISCT